MPTPSEPDDNVNFETIFYGPRALPPPPPPPPLPNSTVASNNTILPTVETEFDEVDNIIPINLSTPMKIDLNETPAFTLDKLPALTHDELLALTYFEPNEREDI